jgi:hypothetical protein
MLPKQVVQAVRAQNQAAKAVRTASRADQLRQELAQRSVSANELAKKAGVSASAVGRIAHGLTDGRPSTWRALRGALDEFPVLTPPEPPGEKP